MNPLHWLRQSSYPRPQAERLARIVTERESRFRGALLGRSREGKTDLLRQVHAVLFDKAEGPIPFFYTFPGGCDSTVLASDFLTAFCQQVRAFLMRQEDLLWEPASTLQRELDRAGLPLSLMELAQTFLGLPPAQQLEFAVSLPAQFAIRERRPVCIIFDDVHSLDRASPFFTALDSRYLSWMLTGRYAFVSRLAGQAAWPLLLLEPLSRDDSLALAQQTCAAAGVRFSRPVWEQWSDLVGTTAWLTSTLIEAAAIREQSLDSIEDLARLYVGELASGTLGHWLMGRFERAVPDPHERKKAAEFIASVANSESVETVTSPLRSEVLAGLVAEEWAGNTLSGIRVPLDMPQRDWLSLQMAPQPHSARSESRALLNVMLRIRQQHRRQIDDALSISLRERLLALPDTGLPHPFQSNCTICSVSSERDGASELFWCYGFRVGRTERTEVGCVFLIVSCQEAPTAGQVDGWRRELQKEVRLFPMDKPAPTVAEPAGSHEELWLLVPNGSSLTCIRGERRFPSSTFLRLIEQANLESRQP